MILNRQGILQAIDEHRMIRDFADITKQCQPASFDVRLGNTFIGDEREVKRSAEGYELKPMSCVLGSSIEIFNLPTFLAGRVEGVSTLGRQFMIVHATAGFIDPGFEGQLTFEIVNLSRHSILLQHGQRIGQIAFHWLVGPLGMNAMLGDALGDGVGADCRALPYSGRYQHQYGATAPRETKGSIK